MTKLWIVFVILTTCLMASSNSYRQNVVNSKKESNSKPGKSPRTRSEVFENLFIVYDPSFLSMVWPKITNGVHVNIERSCWDDLSVFYRALTEGRAWAYSTVDASGRYQPGFFEGNRMWLGSKELCYRLDNEYLAKKKKYNSKAFVPLENDFDDHMQNWSSFNGRKIVTQTSTVDEDTPSHRLQYIALQILLKITKFRVPKSYDISLGLCVPRSCSSDDVISLINFSVMLNDNLKMNGSSTRTVRVTSLRQIEEVYDIRYDPGAVLITLVTMLLLTIAILATIVDIGLIRCLKSQSGSLIVNAPKSDDAATLKCVDSSDKLNRDIVKVIVDLKKERIISKEIERNGKEVSKLNVESMKQNVTPPTITLGVVASERRIACCKRCGKYRKQCTPRMADNSPGCLPVQYKNCASLTNTEYKKRDSIYLNMLLSFSLKHNWKRIFNTKMANKDLAVVHLLRIFATFWVIFLHVALLVDYLKGYKDYNGSNNKHRILTSGTLAFDILFYASGMFSAHHFFYLSSRYTVRELVSCGGRGGKVLQVVCFVTNRAIRLLPPYIYTVFVTAALSRVWRDSAVTSFPEKDYDNCATYWWRNLLYITLFYPRQEQCMQISWYLSAETSLHVFSALLCVALTLRRRAALLALNALLLTAVATDVLRAFTDYHKRFDGVFGAYEYLIERPVARVAPYLMGLLAGWLVHVIDGKTHISKMTSWGLWVASLCAMVTSLVTSALFSHWGCAWLHLCAPAALLWPTVACSTDLAVHGLAARWLLLSQGDAICSEFACVWSYTAGTVVLSQVGALLLSLLVEMPCCCLLRRISDLLTSQ